MNYASYNTYTPATQENAETDHGSPEGFRINTAKGSSRLVVREGQTQYEASGVQSFNTADREVDPGDWRSTAREQSGLPTTRMTEKTLVSINGYGESTIKSFLTMGLLREVSQGVYELAGGRGADAPKGQRQQAQSDDSSTDIVETPDQIIEAQNDALSVFPDHAVASGYALGISQIASGLDGSDLIRQMAQSTGVDPSDAAGRINFIMNTEQAKTDHYVKANGIASDDVAAFYAFARSQKGQLRDVLHDQVHANRMGGWKKLIAGYKASKRG